jgi:hypothetical protein
MEVEDEDNLEFIESDGDEELEESSGEDEDATKETVHMMFDKKTGEAVELEVAASPEMEGEGEGEGGG